ncbi:bifunctional aspartate kinase/homoserine dehydrogenase II, partial [Erwinia amylovora]|nr:bifunctional aspartate kinase/homoserine dehydrogenase II [Erwinia amylovora]
QVQQALLIYQSVLFSSLLPPYVAATLISELISDLEKLEALLDGVMTDAIYAEVVGHGEICSARLMSAVLTLRDIESACLEARDFLRAERAVQPQLDDVQSLPLL